jgi:hypothetical protein
VNKVLRYTIEAVDKSAAVVQQAAKNVQNLGNGIRKALGNVAEWAGRELNALTESPQKLALALGLAAAAGKVWNSVIKAMIDRAKAAKAMLDDMTNERLANTLARQARGYDLLKESIEGAASAARQMSQAEGERGQAATAVAVTGLQAQKAEALAGMSPDDKEGRARVSADFDKQIKAAEIEGKAADAARGVADAEREAAENAERRKNAEERIARLSAQVAEENKRLAKAQDAYASEGGGVWDRTRGTLAGIVSLDAQKGIDSRFKDRDAAKKQMDESVKRLATLSKELEETRKDAAGADAAAPALGVSIEAAKGRAQSVENEKRIAAAEQASADAAADAAAKGAKAREEYVESVKAEAETLREQGRAHLQVASEYAAAAEQLSQKGAERFAQWESVGFRDMDAWRAEEAGKKAGLDDEAKYEKALKKAADRERRLGERSLKKSDKEILDFEKKRQAELKRAADEANKAEQLRRREREERKAADTVQKEIRDLLKRNLQMDGGGNAGGPE